MIRSRGHLFLVILALALIAGQAVAFALGAWKYGWITDARGLPILKDFMEFWTAGRFVLDGTPALAYDLNAIHKAEMLLSQSESNRFLPFPYPPHLLLFVAPLALLPYRVAFIAFSLTTTLFYVATVVAITGRRQAVLFALAMPPLAANLFVGQNGCLTAALMGAALLMSDKDRARAGVPFGLLAYKPQFGPLVPIALGLDRNWYTMTWAAGVLGVLLATSYWILGPITFAAFGHALLLAFTKTLGEGAYGFEKVQSVYGLVRFLRGSDAAAWAAQGATEISCVAALIIIWRVACSRSLRSATLIACTLLFTPHALLYDFVLLGPALAFLFRDQAFDAFEWTAILYVCAILEVLDIAMGPAAFVGPAVVLCLIARRVYRRDLLDSNSTPRLDR